tara:strand:+ start:257 stop:595 length:339 start_codon:yes stop_codon:yes gene_type:complete
MDITFIKSNIMTFISHQEFIHNTNILFKKLLSQQHVIDSLNNNPSLIHNPSLINIMQESTHFNDKYSQSASQIKHLKSAYHHYQNNDYVNASSVLSHATLLAKVAIKVRENS